MSMSISELKDDVDMTIHSEAHSVFKVGREVYLLSWERPYTSIRTGHWGQPKLLAQPPN